MIFLDTSLLVDALTGKKASSDALHARLMRGDSMALSSIVLYEWLRGPRSAQEIAVQDFLFPAPEIVPFEAQDAAVAAQLYRALRRARDREADLAIAAVALRRQAALWTLNAADFRDIPGLQLWQP